MRASLAKRTSRMARRTAGADFGNRSSITGAMSACGDSPCFSTRRRRSSVPPRRSSSSSVGTANSGGPVDEGLQCDDTAFRSRSAQRRRSGAASASQSLSVFAAAVSAPSTCGKVVFARPRPCARPRSRLQRIEFKAGCSAGQWLVESKLQTHRLPARQRAPPDLPLMLPVPDRVQGSSVSGPGRANRLLLDDGPAGLPPAATDRPGASRRTAVRTAAALASSFSHSEASSV